MTDSTRLYLRKFRDELIHGFLYGFVPVVFMFAIAAILNWPVILAWGATFLFLIIGVAVHEAGHAMAAWRVGNRVIYVEVWPVRLVRTISGFRIRRSEACVVLGGATVSVPTGPPFSPRRLRRILLGGPLANIAVGGFLIAGLVSGLGGIGESLRLVMFSCGAMSIWLGLISLIPFSREGVKTDGVLLREIRRNGPELERDGNLALLMGASAAGVRPRDWDAGLIDSILNGPDDLNTSILGSAWAYDRGEFDRALECYEMALTQVGSAPPRAKAAVAVEAAFLVARVQGDAVRARDLLDSAGKERVPKADRLRAEAAILLAEGRPEEACACARRAITALRESFLPGFAIAERDWLEQLIAEATDPSRVEPALPAG